MSNKNQTMIYIVRKIMFDCNINILLKKNHLSYRKSLYIKIEVLNNTKNEMILFNVNNKT